MPLADDRPIKVPPPAPPRPGEPAPEQRHLLGGRALVRAEMPDGSMAWLVGGDPEARQVVSDSRFSRARAVAAGTPLQGFEALAAASLNGMDPPEHTRIRKLVASAFTARRVEALRPRVALIVAELIEEMLAGPRPADLVSAFALPLPVRLPLTELRYKPGMAVYSLSELPVSWDTA
jgi:cytochrome P450